MNGIQASRDFTEVLRLIQEGRARAFQAVNVAMIDTYRGHEKLAPLLRELDWSKHLILLVHCKSLEERAFYLISATREFGSGFFLSNLKLMRKFFLEFQDRAAISQTLSGPSRGPENGQILFGLC